MSRQGQVLSVERFASTDSSDSNAIVGIKLQWAARWHILRVATIEAQPSAVDGVITDEYWRSWNLATEQARYEVLGQHT
jgi:hypothetical protein